MNPVKTYEYLVKAREHVFDAVRELSATEYSRQFEIGLGRIDRTLMHIMLCEERYVQRMQKRDVPPWSACEIQEQNPPAFSDVEQRWRAQASQIRPVLEALRDWDHEFDFQPPADPSYPSKIYTVSPADVYTQLVLHEVHHRAQIMAMLRQLGKAIKDDLDYNALMYKRRPAT